jgi:hypothetical protein
LRLVTWNSQMKFREKITHILPFAADLMVIPECEAPARWSENGYIQNVCQFLWFGDNPSKGIGILSLNDQYTLTIHPAYNSERHLPHRSSLK